MGSALGLNVCKLFNALIVPILPMMKLVHNHTVLELGSEPDQLESSHSFPSLALEPCLRCQNKIALLVQCSEVLLAQRPAD